MRAEAFAGVELYLEKNLSLVYSGREPPVPGAGEMGKTMSKLSSWMILIGKKAENRDAQWRR